MKFRLSRTTQNWSGRPCPEASSVVIKDGMGHDAKIWYVELATLDDLLAFIKKHGDIVVSEATDSYLPPDMIFWIEIYDGYRE